MCIYVSWWQFHASYLVFKNRRILDNSELLFFLTNRNNDWRKWLATSKLWYNSQPGLANRFLLQALHKINSLHLWHYIWIHMLTTQAYSSNQRPKNAHVVGDFRLVKLRIFVPHHRIWFSSVLGLGYVLHRKYRLFHYCRSCILRHVWKISMVDWCILDNICFNFW